MAFVGDAFRYLSSAVDARVVTPVTNRLATSVANPYVLSYFIWDRIKRMTPQRARDLSRLLSTAVSNGVGVLGAEKAKQLAGTTRRLQDEVVAATVTPQGRDVLLNSVATASKVAQAFNTPETKIATQQLFETLQSLIDFFASANGRKVLATASECVSNVCEVAASPESAVFLAEVATNICHALDAEALRREVDSAAAGVKEQQQQQQSQRQEAEGPTAEGKPEMMPSPMSSADDTAFETESNMSEFSLPASAAHMAAATAASTTATTTAAVPAAVIKMKERSALRSARIEKDVLVKMGVDPSMLEEVQRILDQLREEQERETRAASTPVVVEGEEEDFAFQQDTDNEGDPQGDDDDDAESISNAFGLRSSSMPLDLEPSSSSQDRESKTHEEEGDADGVVLPVWHPEPVRNALRRRHVAATERQAQRNAFDDQSRDMTALLARRRISHGDLQPDDVLACRAISQMLIASMALCLLWLVIVVARSGAALFLV